MEGFMKGRGLKRNFMDSGISQVPKMSNIVATGILNLIARLDQSSNQMVKKKNIKYFKMVFNQINQINQIKQLKFPIK